MEPGVSYREFESFKEVMMDAIHQGFQGVHSRLDITNGRIGKHDTEILHLLERATKQSTEIAHMQNDHARAHRRNSDGDSVAHLHARKEDGDDEPITMKDLKRTVWIAGTAVVFTIGAAVVVITMMLDKLPTN